MAYNVSNKYKEVIYSGSAIHKVKLLFNNVEYENAMENIETIEVKSKILSNGEDRFSLDNFVSKEATIKIHNINLENIKEPISLSIGTCIDEENNTFEYVPIGIFNIEGTPTTDKNITTIELRDNSIKFDFNYDASELIKVNGGKATKRQILEDICSKANVKHNIKNFENENDEVGVYDNQLTGRQYIMYLAEQARKIAVINRNGELEFIDINTTPTHKIIADGADGIVESFEENGTYTIGRVEYEDGIRKFTKGEENDYLYINTSNPYISTQEQINAIYDNVKGFSINIIKTGKVMGNPSIDPWDLISFEYNGKTYTTLAQNTLAYNGIILQTFETEIGLEKKTSNVTTSTNEAKFKRVYTNIDDVNGKISLISEEQNSQSSKLSSIEESVEKINSFVGISEDVSINKKGNGKLNFENILGTKPILINIYPTTEDIALLYPRNDLYSSDKTYVVNPPIELRFTNTKTNEVFNYVLPCELYKYDEDNYDILTIDGTNKTCIKTQKVSFNSNTHIKEKINATTIKYSYEDINLTDGDYIVEFIPFSSAYLDVTLEKNNEFTSQYATKAELNSAIEQTNNKIDLSVSEKLDTKEFTKANIVLAINDDTSSAQIQADNIKLEGYTTINNGFSIDTEGNMSCQNANINGDLVTSKGVLTNLQYGSQSWGTSFKDTYRNNGAGMLGFMFEHTSSTSNDVWATFINIPVIIPQGFTVKKAYIYTQHTPIEWGSYGTGYCRNVKAYKLDGLGQNASGAYYGEYKLGGYSPTKEEIKNAMGENGHTYDSNIYEEFSSEDISSIFTDSGLYNIGLYEDIATPTLSNANEARKTLGQYTGYMNAWINIIGYTTNV